MPWNGNWNVDRERRRVTSLTHGGCSHAANIKDLLNHARELRAFELLQGWRDELYGFHGHSDRNKHGLMMERSASPLFGINTYGAHLTAFVNAPNGLKIWVPRRSPRKQTYPGMLDNSVAGGLSFDESPLECIVREAMEEASLPEDLVRQNIRQCGTVSYIHVRDAKAGGESGMFQPECQFVYDLELPDNVIPKPNDEEVEAFYIWGVDKVQEAMANGEFKPNCALVLLDFLVRHGVLTPTNEPNYIEIVSRLHRRLPFPTS